MPAVTICLPTYNAAQYLPTSIESVFDQDFQDYELIICDDGSTDETREVCARYTDPRIRVLHFDNGGQSVNFNRGLQEASGELVAFLHADDYFLPQFLTQRVAQLRQNKNRVLATGAVTHVDDANAPQGLQRNWQEDREFLDGSFVRELLMACLVVPVSMLFCRDAALKAGPFNPELRWGPDWDWVLRLSALGDVFYDATPRANYRVHPGSGTASAIRQGYNGRDERRILSEAFNRLAQDGRFQDDLAALRKSADWHLGLRHMSIAEESLPLRNSALTRRNLRWALQAAPALATRPTFWVLCLCAALPPAVFSFYRKMRPHTAEGSSAMQIAP